MDVDKEASPEPEDEVEAAATRVLFAEAAEVAQLLERFVQTATPLKEAEEIHEKVIAILEKYQEQPQLLNPHLESLVSPLMEVVVGHVASLRGQPSEREAPKFVLVMRVLYVLTKVRGYKSVATHFCHEVNLLEPVFDFYLAAAGNSESAWETRYVLLLWLGTLVLNPFALSSVDSRRLSQGLLTAMLTAGQTALGDCTKASEGAAFFLGRLLTRPDTHHAISDFLQAASDALLR
eukprot:RCo027452